MFLMIQMLEAIGVVLGSLLLAGLVCGVAVRVADRLHHHHWAAFIVLAFLATTVLTGLACSDFVKLGLAYGVFGALFLLIAHGKGARSGNLSQDGNGK